MDGPRATLVLFPRSYRGDHDDEAVAGLRARIHRATGLADIELRQRGPAAIELTFRAHNADERDRVRRQLDDSLDDWTVGEQTTYTLPRSL